MKKRRQMMTFLFRLPQNTAPFDINKHPHWYFAWRELWHMLGSAIVGGITLLLSLLWQPIWIPSYALLMFVIFSLEFDDMKNNQSRMKTAADLMAWQVPYVAICIFSVI